MKGVVLDGAGLLLDGSDNVATAVADLDAGRTVPLDETTEVPSPHADAITLSVDVAFGHKFAVEVIGAGTPVRKYGERIGQSTERIEPGDWVHTHNCESMRGLRNGVDVESYPSSATGGDR
jgi:hypothetical protein